MRFRSMVLWAALVGSAFPGCRSAGPVASGTASSSSSSHDHGTRGHGPVAAAEREGHDGHPGHGVGGEIVQVRYSADDGFAPVRLDVETGTRVILVDESGERLAPRFGVGTGREAEPGSQATDTENPDRGGGHSGHDGHSGHGGHAGGNGLEWILDESGMSEGGNRWIHSFETSGYWRFHNAMAPGHSGLVVALPAPGDRPEALVVNRSETSFPEPPEMTVDDFTALLSQAEKVREYMEAYGPRQTLELLRQAEIETGLDCHHSAHRLGRMAFVEYGATFADLTDVCQSGVRHGLIEQIFVNRGIVNLAEDVDALCPAGESPFVKHQCFHGVGHGIMAWTAYELVDALGFCDRLSEESGRRSCYTGVFMENVVSGLSGAVGQTSGYVNAEDPHYPCNILPEEYVNDCYWYQTTQMLTVFGHDLGRVAEACGEAPLLARRACFGSYGRDVGAAHRRNPYLIVEYCRLEESLMYQGDCVAGAARTLFWDETQSGEGVALCAEVDQPIVAEACYQAIVEQARWVVSDLAPFCGQLPDRWRRRCLDR